MKQSVEFQLNTIDRSLDAIVNFSQGNVPAGMGFVLAAVSETLNSLEAIDVAGAFVDDIQAGRDAVSGQDVAGGYAAVVSARSKMV